MADEFDLRPFANDGEDRLPWLETVQPDDDRPHRQWGRIVAGLVLAVVAAAALVVGIHSYRQHQLGGNGELIAAPTGDYKVKPDDPGGLRIPGEGTSAISTSAGREGGTGAIDLKALPEAPVTGTRQAAGPAPVASAGSHNTVAQVPARGGKLVAVPPIAAPHAAAAGGGGGSLVQLGAFPSESVANAAWANYAKRFSYVAALGKSVQTVSIGGKTLYRLRVNAGSANAAADICGRLKVAGEPCFVAS
jgi:hypothetical protein